MANILTKMTIKFKKLSNLSRIWTSYVFEWFLLISKGNPKNLQNLLFFGQKTVIFSFFLFLFRNTNFYGKCNNVFKNGPIDLIFCKNVPYGVCNSALYGFGQFLCFGWELGSFLDLGGIFGQKLAKICPRGDKNDPKSRPKHLNFPNPYKALLHTP